MKVARGTVTDRPWGLTLGSFALRRLTGQLDLVAADGKVYSIAFVDGNIVAARSPLTTDSIGRIALTSHLVPSNQVSEIAKRVAAAGDRDEVDVAAAFAKLTPDQAVTLRRRAIVQRAARTFSVDQGEYAIDSDITLPTDQVTEVDVRAVLYLGIRMNLSEERLTADMRAIGTSFVLKPNVTGIELSKFELSEECQPVVAALYEGASLAELEATQREIEPRTLQAVVYALTSAGACDATGARQAQAAAEPVPPRTKTSSAEPRTRTIPAFGGTPVVERVASGAVGANAPAKPAVSRTSTPVPAAAPLRPPAPPSTPPATRPANPPPSPDELTRSVRARTEIGLPGSTRSPAVSRTTTPRDVAVPRTATPRDVAVPRTMSPSVPRTKTARRLAAREAEAAIASRLALMEQGADHFAMLGVVFGAPPDAVRAAYFALARLLHPDKLAELEVEDPNAARVFAQVNVAFNTLTDPARRSEYLVSLEAGEPTPIVGRSRTSELTDKAAAAEEHFQRGQQLLKREQPHAALPELAKAYELNPSNVNYLAALAWAEFCGSSDKAAIAPKTRKALEKAILHSPDPLAPHLYLGRVERILGRDREALHHFRSVLDLAPNHADAASEVRMIEARLGAKR